MNTYFHNFIKISRNYFSGVAKIKKGEIVNYQFKVKKMPDFTKVLPGAQIRLKLRSARVPTKIKEIMPPQNDFLNFNKMSGNEILLNLTNCEYFTDIELVASLLELNKRINLDVNSEFNKKIWIEHPYVWKAMQRLVLRIQGLNLRLTLASAMIFERYRLFRKIVWNKIEKNILISFHKIKTFQLAYLLDIFDKNDIGSEEFYSKLITILPIHVDYLSMKEFTRVFEVCLNQKLGTDRLFHVFFLRKLEKNVHKISFDLYIRNLISLAKRKFDLDTVFYTNFMLPPIFKFEYNSKQAKTLLEALNLLEENCKNVDFTKYIEIIEDLTEEFVNYKSNKEEKEIKLKIKSDLSIVAPNLEEEKTIDTHNLEEELNIKLKKGFEIDDVEKSRKKEDIDEEMEVDQENITKKISKKEEKKIKIEERRKKKMEKDDEEKEIKEEINQEIDVESKEIHKGPKRNTQRGNPIKVTPDLGVVENPKYDSVEGGENAKKNKKLKKVVHEEKQEK